MKCLNRIDLEGYYEKEPNNYLQFKLIIQDGIVHRAIPLERNDYGYINLKPKENAKFELHKLINEESVTKKGSNYAIKYLNDYNQTVKVLMKLNMRNILNIKWQKGEFLIQSNQLKVDLIKYFIGGLLGSFVTILFEKY